VLAKKFGPCRKTDEPKVSGGELGLYIVYFIELHKVNYGKSFIKVLNDLKFVFSFRWAVKQKNCILFLIFLSSLQLCVPYQWIDLPNKKFIQIL
jgi:hypothetical protein